MDGNGDTERSILTIGVAGRISWARILMQSIVTLVVVNVLPDGGGAGGCVSEVGVIIVVSQTFFQKGAILSYPVMYILPMLRV